MKAFLFALLFCASFAFAEEKTELIVVENWQCDKLICAIATDGVKFYLITLDSKGLIDVYYKNTLVWSRNTV